MIRELSVAGAGLLAVAAASGQVREFIFAPANGSYTGVIFAGDPIIGQEVFNTRITLIVTVEPGGNAAEFEADIAFPLIPFPGNENVLRINGGTEGWTGSGTFSLVRETAAFNGTFIATLFGGETIMPPGFVHEESKVEMFYIPAPGPAGLMAIAGVAAAFRRRR